MTDAGSPNPVAERAGRVVDLLGHCVRTELQVTSEMLGLGLSDERTAVNWARQHEACH